MKNIDFKPKIKLIFLGVFILHLADLFLFCFNFTFVFSDSDQTILWNAANDMSRGLFYEPAFYGQSYNTMIEALIAVPLIWAGVFIPYAVSISTTVLTYSVIWLYTSYYYKLKNFHLAMICLALPVLMPTEFQVMTTISRGFVPGIVFTLYGVYCFLTYKTNLKLLFAGLFISLGIVFNPNCSVILVPFMIYYTLNPSFIKRNSVYFIFLGSLPALFYKAFCIWFYSTYPNHNLHVFPNPMAFSFHSWVYSASEIFYLLKGLLPVVNNMGCLSIILLLVLVVLILKRSNKNYEKLAAIAGFLFILFSFGVNKVTDGTGSPFFPYARMFLAIPALYIFYISILGGYVKTIVPLYVTALLITGAFVFKSISLPDRILYMVKHNTGVVTVFQIKSLCQSCDSIQNFMKVSNTELLVLGTKRDQVNYGCPVLNPQVKTILPWYERRLWVYENEMFVPRTKFLFYKTGSAIDSFGISVTKNYYVVTLPTPISLDQWYKDHHYDLRGYIK